MKKFIGTKEFYLTTIAIALPIMAQQFVTSFVNLIDNIMIGSVGSIALTSVTVTPAVSTLTTFARASASAEGAANAVVPQARTKSDANTAANFFIGLFLLSSLFMWFLYQAMRAPRDTD